MMCFHFIAPESIKEHLLSAYNMPGTMLSDYLTESTLQMYYYLHSTEEETEVKILRYSSWLMTK